MIMEENKNDIKIGDVCWFWMVDGYTLQDLRPGTVMDILKDRKGNVRYIANEFFGNFTKCERIKDWGCLPEHFQKVLKNCEL